METETVKTGQLDYETEENDKIHLFSNVNPSVVIATIYSDPLDAEAFANAQHIKRTWNSHYELLEALIMVTKGINNKGWFDKIPEAAIIKAQEAIKKATK